MQREELRRAAEAAARALAASAGGAVVISVTGPEGRITCRAGQAECRPRAPSGPTACERDILRLLAASGVPTTTSRLLSALAAAGLIHGESTVVHALARMSRAGVVVASCRSPRGYRLP